MIQNLDLYKFALDCASNHIIITDTKGVIQYANTSVTRITGYTLDEILGNTPKLWGGQMDQSFYKELWTKIFDKKEIFKKEVRNRRKNGEIYYAEITISPVFDSTGLHIGYIGMEEDISERKNLEKQLRHERDRLETVISSMAEGLIVTDPQGTVTFINAIAQILLQTTFDESVGKNIREIFPLFRFGKPLHANEHPLEKISQAGSTSTVEFDSGYTVHIRSGVNFPISLKATSFQEKDHAGVVIVFNDVTREKEIDQRKTDFISLASHQLRTPLSASKWYLEMLLTGDAGEITTEQREFVKNIDFSNNRMISLVNSLLNISRIESGRILIKPETVSVTDLIDELLIDFMPDITLKQLDVTKKFPENGCHITSDPKLLTHVFLVLMSNAIRYSPTNEKIIIEVSCEETQVVISIIDRGYGISTQDQDRVFEKFFRGENAAKLVTDGSGLGLYLARLIVQELQGSIFFKSTINKGSTFTVTFPKKGLEYRKGEVALDSSRTSY